QPYRLPLHDALPISLPDEILAQKQIRQAVGAALAQLEPEQREVLVLRDMEGLTAAEVAEVMSTSVPAVKSRLHRARARLRDTVRSEEHTSELQSREK